MPSNRTTVTELATALGMLGATTIDEALGEVPRALVTVSDSVWQDLREMWDRGTLDDDFRAGFENGRAFLLDDGALARRTPRIIEWTGGRRPPGDEVVPSDLRVDHVYLISCKYLSRILHNLSPARLVEGLLTRAPIDDRTDWYERVAPAEHQALYEACKAGADLDDLPDRVGELTPVQRRQLARALRSGWPAGAETAYGHLCHAVTDVTASLWAARVGRTSAEAMLWRLLRIGSTPYFVLGTDKQGSLRLRVDTPWDWRQRYRLKRFSIAPQGGGQPRISWFASCEDRVTGEFPEIRGHIEIRWSHGRFGQRPEAKVYLDIRHEDVPGYHPLGGEAPTPRSTGHAPTDPSTYLGAERALSQPGVQLRLFRRDV